MATNHGTHVIALFVLRPREGRVDAARGVANVLAPCAHDALVVDARHALRPILVGDGRDDRSPIALRVISVGDVGGVTAGRLGDDSGAGAEEGGDERDGLDLEHRSWRGDAEEAKSISRRESRMIDFMR